MKSACSERAVYNNKIHGYVADDNATVLTVFELKDKSKDKKLLEIS